MEISIIILNYKQAGLVKYCISGIKSAHINRAYEIIVVDNNSDDGCLEMVKENFPDVKTIRAQNNKGMGAGNNLGIQKASGKYIMIINPDIAIFPGEIEKMYDYLEAHSDVGIVGPKLINPDKSIQLSSRRFYSWKTPIFRRTLLGKTNAGQEHVNYYLMKDFDHGTSMAVDWLFGACLFIRKSAIDSVGMFDERFFMYFEDCDLCRRFWEKDWKVMYLADCKIVHYHHRESAQRFSILSLFNKASRNHMASGLKYFLKYRKRELPR